MRAVAAAVTCNIRGVSAIGRFLGNRDRDVLPREAASADRPSGAALADVIPGAPPAARDLEITNLAYDTRQVTPGRLFFCVPGFTRDGHEFAPSDCEWGRGASR
jgi:hypothetical protein